MFIIIIVFIILQIQDVYNGAYFSRWYEFLNSREMLTLLTRGKRRVVIKAGGFLEMNLETGLAVSSGYNKQNPLILE